MRAAPELKVHRSTLKALKLFDADRLHWLDAAAAEGPLVALRMGAVTTWVVTDPQSARTMLVSDGASWTRPPALRVPVRVGVGENLFSQSDKAWSLTQPFVAPAFRKRALESRLAEIDALIDREVRAIPRDTTVDLELIMGRISLRVAAWVLLGDELDQAKATELADHQREVVGWVGVQLGRINGFLPVAFGTRARQMRRHRAALDAYADGVIARVTAAPADDVAGALVRARTIGQAPDPAPAARPCPGPLAGRQRDHRSRVVVGARARSRGTRRVAPRPERSRPVHGIVSPRDPAPHAGRLGHPAHADPSGRHPHRRRRHHPSAPGQLATVYLRGINRDPHLWDDPLRFDPSRHRLDGQQDHRTLIPFGLGPRGCIGQHLAMAELRAITPALARHGDVTVEGSTTEDASFALRVRNGLVGRFTDPEEERSGPAIRGT